MRKIELSESNTILFQQLASLREELDSYTLEKYQRINPLFENLCDWNEKGTRFGKEGTVLYDSATIIGDVQIGAHCWIGLNTIIDGTGGLIIGDYVTVSSGVHIYTHDTVRWALSGGKALYEYSPVTIGNCVFIGAQSVVLRGVGIGEHSLICANATVTKDVPPFSIVAGTPARVIGRVIIDNDGVKLEYLGR